MGVDGTPSEGEGRGKKRDRSGEPNQREKEIKETREKLKRSNPVLANGARERERERESSRAGCSQHPRGVGKSRGDAPSRERSPEAPRRRGELHKVRRVRSDAGGGMVYCD